MRALIPPASSPGATALILITRVAVSREVVRTKASSAALEDAYAACPALGRCAAVEEMTTMLPLRLRIIGFNVALVLLGTVFLLALRRYFNYAIAAPLRKLAERSSKIAQGEFPENMPIASRDEIGLLSHSFNHMAERLKEHQEKLTGLAILEERERLACELHDSLAQDLACIRLKLIEADKRVGANETGAVQEMTRDLFRMVDEAYQDLRESIFGLRALRLRKDIGVVNALTEFLRDFSEVRKLPVELCVANPEAIQFAPQVEIQFIRILHEALTNMVKHAGATRGKITITTDDCSATVTIEDDGRGIDVSAVRARARERGLLQPGRVLSDEEALQLILEPGFSTASTVTQHAGRGVGMDVVVNEIKKLGGALFTESQPGLGVKFTIRLPFTLAITQALIVRTGEELYALPLPSVEGVARVPRSEVQKHLAEDSPTFTYGKQVYRFQHLGAFIGGGASVLPEADVSMPVILIRAGDHSTAVVTDELVGSREMVVKSVGPQIAGIRGIAGATILGDGRIVIILDLGALVRSEWRGRKPLVEGPTEDRRTFALVVDDSITVRRVTQRLLERHGMRVMTAKDGVDALSILQDHLPDVILLDIEMPRMDGYELASQVRGDARLADIPIVMITSRVGEKHRARAIELGVNDYLGKPYQENQLLDAIEPLVEARRRKAAPAQGRESRA